MELNKFIKRFLPEYKEKRNKWVIFNHSDRLEFSEKHFQEALENYTKELCYRQRLICAKVYNDIVLYGKHQDVSQFDAGYYIENADQPNIDEL